MSSLSLIVLAAGSSSRLGSPKQLKEIGGKPLLQFVLDAGLNSSCSRVYLILGSPFDTIQAGLKKLEADKEQKLCIVRNESWNEGMASSIVAGIRQLKLDEPESTAAIIATCDQPFINSDLIDQMIALHKDSPDSMIACKYADTIGVPALFPANYFSQLEELKGNEGARKILRSAGENPLSIEFPEGSIDIDTESDWEDFLRLSGETTITG